MNACNLIQHLLRGSLIIIVIITRQVLGRPEDEKLYANYAPHFNFGPIERGEKQTNNID